MSAYKILYLFIGFILICGSSFADTISLSTISADSTRDTFNTNFTTISNAINGQVQGSATTGSSVNVLADSIGELDMGDEVNPRVRDSELLSVTTDSTTAQNAFVYSGFTIADSATLAGTIAAGVAYINGYRVSKTATAKTFTASKDTWVDVSQTGSFTYTEVTVGAAEPAVASNSARLAKVTTDGSEITAVTDEANRRLPGLLIPSNYRDGLVVSRDSATTITVLPGSAEINSTIVPKTSTTTLTISTAGDWAGGTSLRAADTYAFVGSDDDGNLKLHTTAPTHDNYGVSTTAGKKRYATWSSTVYRILGWFYMDGSQNVENASNVKEHGLSNTVSSQDSSQGSLSAATFTTVQRVNFYNSGGPIVVAGTISADSSAGGYTVFPARLVRDSTTVAGCGSISETSAAGLGSGLSFTCLETNRPQGTVTYNTQARVDGNTALMKSRNLVIAEQ